VGTCSGMGSNYIQIYISVPALVAFLCPDASSKPL
jgi:hypothetical protein